MGPFEIIFSSKFLFSIFFYWSSGFFAMFFFLLFAMFFLVFPQNLLTTSGLCTYIHVFNQHYIDRTCKTAYQPMHRNCSALYFVVSKEFHFSFFVFCWYLTSLHFLGGWCECLWSNVTVVPRIRCLLGMFSPDARSTFSHICHKFRSPLLSHLQIPLLSISQLARLLIKV